MKVPLGSPPPALGSARKVTEVRRDENMQARTGGNTRDGHQVISLGWGDNPTKKGHNQSVCISYQNVFEVLLIQLLFHQVFTNQDTVKEWMKVIFQFKGEKKRNCDISFNFFYNYIFYFFLFTCNNKERHSFTWKKTWLFTSFVIKI